MCPPFGRHDSKPPLRANIQILSPQQQHLSSAPLQQLASHIACSQPLGLTSFVAAADSIDLLPRISPCTEFHPCPVKELPGQAATLPYLPLPCHPPYWDYSIHLPRPRSCLLVLPLRTSSQFGDFLGPPSVRFSKFVHFSSC